MNHFGKKIRALLSVYDKEGLGELAKALDFSGCELVSSGGTASFLERAGFPVTPVEKITGNPEAFDGRMKTLSFQVESAILFDRDNPVHCEEARKLGIVPIDFVVCNFYPFEKALSEKQSLPDAIELIDIGGPAMVRAAAKNFKHVVVLPDPGDYRKIQDYLLAEQEIPLGERLRLAAKAFQITAYYDSRIDFYFQEQLDKKILWFRFGEGEKLRYGENPHQSGFVYWSEDSDPLSLKRFAKVSGKELSFNNYLDIHAAVNTLALLGGERPACVIVKHANPCGAAIGEDIDRAFDKAWEGDPVAAFGGIVAFNRPITLSMIRKFVDEKKFAEVFVAPQIEEAALQAITEKRKNLMVLLNPALFSPVQANEQDIRKIRGGILRQETDTWLPDEEKLQVVSKRFPTQEERRDLLFAWKIGRESKSNSIVLAREEQIVGSGVGQQDRLRACKLAVEKAATRAQGACAASDAFFPFPDGPELLIKGGITAIIHPGGSIRDDETIKLCDRHEVALVTTKGIRAFKH